MSVLRHQMSVRTSVTTLEEDMYVLVMRIGWQLMLHSAKVRKLVIINYQLIVSCL